MSIASPPPSSHPDTVSASASSDLPPTSTPPLPHHHDVASPLSSRSLSYFPEPPHSGISTVTAAATSPVRQSVSSIKRKPLSSTASPLATRFSQSSATTSWPPSQIDLPTPGARFSRSTSIDSPTLYEYTAASSVVSRPPPLQ